MNLWDSDLTAGDQNLGNVKIKYGIFQRDSLSHLLFVLMVISPTLLLKKTKIFYQLKKIRKRINQLIFTGDLKYL